jgi:hypothetical protein
MKSGRLIGVLLLWWVGQVHAWDLKASGESWDYERACNQPLKQQQFDRVLQQCPPFLIDASLAGKAHAALSTAYLWESDLSRSVEHARLSADLGDSVGHYLSAYHLLNGPGVPDAVGKARSMLLTARSLGYETAQKLLDAIDQQDACTKLAGFKFAGSPVFCLFRSQLQTFFRTRGLVPYKALSEDNVETYSAATLIDDASTLEVRFERNAADGLLRPASLVYNFPGRSDNLEAVWSRLSGTLTEKYGAPLIPHSRVQWAWIVPDGIRVELAWTQPHQLQVRYLQSQRLAGVTSDASRKNDALRARQKARDLAAL